MPRFIKMTCPDCRKPESLTVAFGEPYRDFGDGMDDADLRVDIVAQECPCEDVDDSDAVTNTIWEWMAECYPYKMKGEWSGPLPLPQAGAEMEGGGGNK